MVKLTEKLLGILDKRSDTLTGQEIKNLAEAIQISESIPDKGQMDLLKEQAARQELIVVQTLCEHERAKGTRCPDCGKQIGWEPDPY